MTTGDIVLRLSAYIEKQINKQRKKGTGTAYIELDQAAKSLRITLDQVNEHLDAAMQNLPYVTITKRQNSSVKIEAKSGAITNRWTPLDG